MTVRYVALGDSYTIGTSVAASERWPDKLVRALGAAADGTPRLELVANLALNGRTSGDLRRGQLPRLATLAPGFVTVLIGVNDVVQRVPLERYRENVAVILDELAAHVPAGRVLAVTTPDYTVTPAGADFGDPAIQRAEIVRINGVLTELATARAVPIIDIVDISQRAAGERTLVAGDGLHPSASQYDLWVERIAPLAAQLLGPR